MPVQNEKSVKIADEFRNMLETLHSAPEVWDNDLDKQIHKWYSDPPTVFPRKPYFSPSAATACPLSLYAKAKGAKRDETDRQPHQARWQRIGTAIGDIIQRDVLLCERHFKKIACKDAPFRFLRTGDGRPAFEDFAKTNSPVKIHNDDGEIVEYNLFGAPDGIMEYTDADGTKIRVGLEIKSKQTTSARTSNFTLREADESHLAQTVAYSYMYGCDYYLIIYVNASKKSWVMTDEEYEKSPDMRVFGYYIDDGDRYDLLSKLADIQTAVNNDEPPKLDVDGWTFNNFKSSCIELLTPEDVEEIAEYGERISKSNLPEFRIKQVLEVVEEIKIRKEAHNESTK